jgi:hypothetical protein
MTDEGQEDDHYDRGDDNQCHLCRDFTLRAPTDAATASDAETPHTEPPVIEDRGKAAIDAE